jgi:hypothetical protein
MFNRLPSVLVALILIVVVALAYHSWRSAERSAELRTQAVPDEEVAGKHVVDDSGPKKGDTARQSPFYAADAKSSDVLTMVADEPARKADTAASNHNQAEMHEDELSSADPTSRLQNSDRDFPVSPSVKAACASYLASGRDLCDKENELLMKFARESRDPVWANLTEQKLMRFVASEGDKFRVRSLECRSSVCAMEVESKVGPYLGIGYEREKTHSLHDDKSIFGYERGDGGVRITVTLRIVERG